MRRSPKSLSTLSLPAQWEGCEHVTPCTACASRGFLLGLLGRESCPACEGRKVRWSGVSIPTNMLLRGYSVADGVCYHGSRQMTEGQVIANIWQLDGEVVPVYPVVSPEEIERQAGEIAMVGGLV